MAETLTGEITETDPVFTAWDKNYADLTNAPDLSVYATTTEVDAALEEKVDKEPGKGLSTEDYTTPEKDKLAGIEPGAQANVQVDWDQEDPAEGDFIKNKPAIPDAPDGSETKVTAGSNVTVAGIGTEANPYVISASSGTMQSDSIVLRDSQDDVRFVLNPNTGMFKMMHNDTVWYSIEVGSPHVITHHNDDGSMTVSKGNGYEIYVFDEMEKNKDNPKRSVKYEQTAERDKFTATTTRNDPNFGDGYHKTTTEFHTKRDEYGNYLTTEKTQADIVSRPDGSEKQRSVIFEDLKSGLATLEIIEDGQTIYYKKEYFDENGNKIIEEESTDNGTTKKGRTTYNKLGEQILVEVFEDDKKQSETTYTSSVVPETGLSTDITIEKLFDAAEDLFQQTTKTTQIKATESENSIIKSNEIKRLVGGILIGTSKITDRYIFFPDGSVTQTINQITEGDNTYSVFQVVKNNGITTTEKRFEKNEELPGSGATLREQTNYDYDNNASGKSTEYRNELGNLVFAKSEVANLEDGTYSIEVDVPGYGKTTITQGVQTVEITADDVVSDGNHYVTGEFGVVGDFGAFVSKDLSVYGNSSVEGDHEVGGNVKAFLDLVARGTKKFRIDHPQFPDTKFLQHASIESNEVLNLYSGNVETDIDGNATVTLPDYFDLINTDFRYQLTVIGTTFARAIIFSEIDETNQFVIKTDEPNTKVSWQVTAKRNDQYLIDNPFEDVVDK